MRAIRNGLQGAGIPVENSKGEWGPGQEEINVRYAEALEMADRHVILKNGCKEIAWSRARPITFMAKWNYGLAGSSSTSTIRCGRRTARRRCSSTRRPNGMSPLMKSFVGAGQLKYARDITYVPGALHQFLQALPGRHLRADQGDLEPRQPHRRLPAVRRGNQGIRIECRVGGADLNPYLAFAALIAAGLAGIERS
jgi:glutamine synthetase